MKARETGRSGAMATVLCLPIAVLQSAGFGVRALTTTGVPLPPSRSAPIFANRRAHSALARFGVRKPCFRGARRASVLPAFGVRAPCSRGVGGAGATTTAAAPLARARPTGADPPRCLATAHHGALRSQDRSGALRAPRQHGWRTPKNGFGVRAAPRILACGRRAPAAPAEPAPSNAVRAHAGRVDHSTRAHYERGALQKAPSLSRLPRYSAPRVLSSRYLLISATES